MKLGARFYDPEIARFITQDSYLGESSTPPSLHRYLYAYGNPTVYIDLFGYASSAWLQPTAYSETDIFRPTPVRDTGYQIVDDLWAGTDSILNFGKYLVNGVVGISSLPTIAYAKYNDISVQEADEEIVGYMASSGPLAPYLMTGSLPFRAGSTLSYTARALRAEAKITKKGIASITRESRSGFQEVKRVIKDKSQKVVEAYKNSHLADETGSISVGPTRTSRKWKYNDGWDYKRVQKEVTRAEKGKRPDPSTYLKKEYMDAHRAMFEKGVARIQPSAPKGKIGRTETWVIPLETAQKAIKKSKGDPRNLEKLLGFDKGYLGDKPVLIEIPKQTGYRIPSGNEFGANDFWRPGGYTYPGKLPEAVIDPVSPGNYTVKDIY